MNPAALRRPATVLALAVAALAVPLAAPIGVAEACACGAYSPTHGGTATVTRETALVRSPGDGTEDIYLSLTLDSDVRSGALLFPVPDRHATVTAGPRSLFADLAAITTPPAHPGSAPAGGGNGAAAPAPRVTVESRQAIGPLDVVTLSATDAGALSEWLTHNGFTAKPALRTSAAPYLAEGWAFMAVRLRPEAAATTRLDGQLDPLHLHFRTDRTVYPMRLSHEAAEPASVTVYTLGAHELRLTTADPGMALAWAGPLDPAAHPALAPVTAAGTTFLTRYDGTLTPATISDDFHFSPAASDTPFRRSPAGDVVPVRAAAEHDDAAKTTFVLVGVLLIAGLLAVAIVRRPGRGTGRQ